MMKPDDFRKLVSAGLSSEQIAVVMEMMERDANAFAEAEEARKAKGRERIAKWRNDRRNVTVPLHNVTVPLVGGDAHVEDKTSNLEIEPQKEEKKESALTREFEDWYAGYPHKVQRGAAERAFPKARSLASLDELKAGVARYVESKPADRAWQNPSTWLNGKGWLDQPANVVPMARGSPRPVHDLINSLLSDMDHADAVSTAQIEGYPAAPSRLPARFTG